MEGDKTSPLETSGLREKEPVPASVRLRNKRLAAANTASFIAVLAFNGLAGSGKLTGTSIGEVSRLYPTYITPEGFAFSIWGVIYTCMSLLVLFGLTSQGQCSARLFDQGGSSGVQGGVGWAFVASNATNIIWIALFTEHSTAAVWSSCAFIFVLLAMLLLAYQRARCWAAPWTGPNAATGWPAWAERVCLDLGFSLYCGWVTVASIVNVACAAGPGGSNLAGESPSTNAAWATAMLMAALTINAAVVARKRDPVFPLVLAWAANAIRAKNHDDRVNKAAIAVALCGLVLALSAGALRVRGNGSKDAGVYAGHNAA